MPSKIEIIYLGVLEGHKDAVYALERSNKAGEFFSAGGDGMIIRWDLSKKGDGDLIARMPSSVYSLLYFAENQTLLAGTRFGNLYALDLENHKQKNLIHLNNDVFRLCYLPAQNLVAAACGGGYIYMLHPESLEIVHEIHPVEESCRALAWHPDGKQLASGWSDGKIRIYDLDADFMEIQNFKGHLPSVFSLAYNATGSLLFSGGRDAQIRIWDAANAYFETRQIPAHLYTVNDLVMMPEAGIFASGSRDKSVKIWDAENFDLLKVIDKPKLPAHSHSVNKLLWTGYDNNLISAGDDKVIRVWGIIC